MKRNAAASAAMLARCCFDYDGKALLPVIDPFAIATLERAFTRMLQAGGERMAMPLSEAEARAFSRPGKAGHVPGGAIWLAVGADVSGRATYSIQSAGGEDRALTHEAAQAMALSRLHARKDGRHVVRTLAGDVLAVCATDVEAWGRIDRHTAEGQADTDRHHRIRQSGPFACPSLLYRAGPINPTR